MVLHVTYPILNTTLRTTYPATAANPPIATIGTIMIFVYRHMRKWARISTGIRKMAHSRIPSQ